MAKVSDSPCYGELFLDGDDCCKQCLAADAKLTKGCEILSELYSKDKEAAVALIERIKEGEDMEEVLAMKEAPEEAEIAEEDDPVEVPEEEPEDAPEDDASEPEEELVISNPAIEDEPDEPEYTEEEDKAEEPEYASEERPDLYPIPVLRRCPRQHWPGCKGCMVLK